MEISKISKEAQFIISELKKNGFEAYLVGGCVRDMLRGVEPHDWDCATNATPEQIGKIFLKSYANNDFGTVTAQIESKQGLIEVEITPYRTESKYTDKRHPDEVKWAKTIEDDLSRRDFTVNAIAITLDGKKLEIVDFFEGQKDLKNKVIRAVGKPDDRFNEDALRMMRAIRFFSTLGKEWKIDLKIEKAIKKNSQLLSYISKERLRDEFIKIIMSERASDGVELLRALGLLKHIAIELGEGYGVAQNKHHIYDVYEHLLRSLKYATEQNFNKYVRMSALFHDIGKPRTKCGKGEDATFYNHEIVGARMTDKILYRLKFSKKDIKKIVKLVRYHLFYYNVDEVTEASVRRLVRQVGIENMDELLQVRMCDRIGSGVPKAEPYKLRHLRYVIEKVSQDPISVKMLKINGQDVMNILGISPSPAIGYVLDILLGKVLTDPENNSKEFLEQEIESLMQKCDISMKRDDKGMILEKSLLCLQKLAIEAKKKREEIIMKKDEVAKGKYWVT